MTSSLPPTIYQLYQDSLLSGFYIKRGKSVVIPQIVYALNAMQKRHGKKKISLLDIGCHDGALLKIIQQISSIMGMKDRLQLAGLDKNVDALRKAQITLGDDVSLYAQDLCSGSLDGIPGKFDIIIVINTFHEVYTNFYKECHADKPDDEEYVATAKKKTAHVIKEFASRLSKHGMFILYDGLDVDVTWAEKVVQFRFVTPDVERRAQTFLKGYTGKILHVKKIENNIYEMNMRDFQRLISTLKFTNTSLWEIESKESYAYFSLKEFKQLMKDVDCLLDSYVMANHDRGLWRSFVEILSPEIDFPYQSAAMTFVTRDTIESKEKDK